MQIENAYKESKQSKVKLKKTKNKTGICIANNYMYSNYVMVFVFSVNESIILDTESHLFYVYSYSNKIGHA